MKQKSLTEILGLLEQRIHELKTKKDKWYKRLGQVAYIITFSVLLRVCLFLNRMEAKRT